MGMIVVVVKSKMLHHPFPMLTVRSMSLLPLVNSLQLSVLPQTSNTVMMLPFRTLASVAHQPHRVLTRTMVHRMRLPDLKEELERRGIIIGMMEKLKRPDLVSMLLDAMPNNKSVSTDSPSINGAEPSVRTKENHDNMNIHGDIHDKTTKHSSTDDQPSPTKNDESLKKVGQWSVQQYPIQNLQFDPNTTYALTAMGVTLYGKKIGTGVGITMRECNNNTIVWQAQKFYPGYRSVFEADYTAIILALRFALQSFHLKKVQMHVSNFVLLDQITGKLQVSKPSLQLLLGQVNQFIKENEMNDLVFQIAEQENRMTASALAHDALNTQTSFNLHEEDEETDDVDDPMTEILLHNGGVALMFPKTVVENDSDHALKLLEFVKPNDVVIDPSLTYKLRFDGGSRGNPGIAGAGMVLYDDQMREIWRGVKYLGRNMSNNLAEYSALNIGLTHALSIGIERIHCEGDSQLVVKHLNGVYKVKSENLVDLFRQTRSLLKKFKSCQVSHIRREFNARADELANQGTCAQKYK